MNKLNDTAATIVETATRLGASEVTAWASEGTWTDVKQRDGRIEKWQDSQSCSASAAFFVNDRYSVHSTNDLRPEALEQFIGRAIEATRHLEPDPDRRLADPSSMGSHDNEPLDLVDDKPVEIDHRTWVDEVQQSTSNAISKNLRSAEGFVWSGSSRQVMVTSNGFSGSTATTEFGHGADISMEDTDGRLPEAADWAVARHHSDLLSVDDITVRAAERAKRRLGSGPVSSRRGAMLVENRVVSRILGTLVSPMYGGAIYEQRSCLESKLGEQIAASNFNLLDDPHIPRGLGSRPHDGDGRPTVARDLVKDGVLQTWLLNVYYARRLNRTPTTSSPSNLMVPQGDASPMDLIADLPWAIQVDGFLGGNSNAATGKYSFGIRGTLFEKGQPVAPISEMNITGSVFDLLNGFIAAGNDPWTSGSCRSPSLLFDAVQFSGQ
jgi:PmbA protein